MTLKYIALAALTLLTNTNATNGMDYFFEESESSESSLYESEESSKTYQTESMQPVKGTLVSLIQNCNTPVERFEPKVGDVNFEKYQKAMEQSREILKDREASGDMVLCIFDLDSFEEEK